MSLIQPPAAEYKPAYDLTVTHRSYRRGDLQVWLTWNRNSGEPCLVITPRDPHLSNQRVIPCVVPMNRAWVWDEAIGDPAEVEFAAALFCMNLGFNPYNVRNVNKLTGIVRDYLGELVAMPPMPTDDRQVVAEAIITENATGKQTYKEVTDHA